MLSNGSLRQFTPEAARDTADEPDSRIFPLIF
jgi:hypothetical protein